MAKKYLLFDGRYHYDEDRAICFEVCDSLREARASASEYGDDTVVVECEETGNNELASGKIINQFGGTLG